MNFQTLISLSTLIIASFAQYCTEDNWELISTERGLVCWKLLDAADFAAKFDVASKVCEALPEGKTVTVKNEAEKAVFSDLANRVLEPTLSCYKSSQFAVEGKFKSVDFEEPPEYLKVLNREGKVKLKERIQRDDEISIVFSFKLSNLEKAQGLKGRIRIGSSSNTSYYSIDLECKLDFICSMKHPGLQTPVSFTLYKAEEKKKLSVEFFGRISFAFLDKTIQVWGDKTLTIPDDYSYLKMDEILVEHIIVSNIEHTKICKSMNAYSYEKFEFNPRKFPKLSNKVNGISAVRRKLGSEYIYILPGYFMDYFDLESENRFVFDVKLERMKGNDYWGQIHMEFWSHESSESIFTIQISRSQLVITHSGLPSNPIDITGLDIKGKNLLGIRLLISLNPKSKEMSIETDLIRIGYSIPATTVSTKLRNFEEIRLLAPNAYFYDVEMKALKEVIMETCNYRPLGEEILLEQVPYRPTCFRRRNVLCEKPSVDTKSDVIPDEAPETYIWEEEEKEDVTEKATIEEVEKEKEKILEQKKIEEKKKMEEEEVEIKNLNEFQWSIIAMTSLTFASFLAILSLNLVRCWV